MSSDAAPKDTTPKTAEQLVKEDNDIARIVKDDNAVAKVSLLLSLSSHHANHVGTFEQKGGTITAGEDDLLFLVAEDETVLSLYVRSDAAEELREAGFDI